MVPFRILPLLSVLALSSSLATSACSSDGDGTSSGAPAATGCAADDRKDVYTAGLVKAAGSVTVKLVESNPGPPIKGTNTMTFEVLDAEEKPIDGANVTITPWMPDHAHGSAVKPVVTPSGNGIYNVESIYLAMAGLWQIRVAIQLPGGGALQETMFQFCLDG